MFKGIGRTRYAEPSAATEFLSANFSFLSSETDFKFWHAEKCSIANQ